MLLINDHSDMVNLLISKGANVNLTGYSDATALMLSSAVKNSQSLKLLIKAGADVNAKSKYGWTALTGAIKHSDKNNIVELIKAGANVNIEFDGDTPLKIAKKLHNDQIVTILISAGAKE